MQNRQIVWNFGCEFNSEVKGKTLILCIFDFCFLFALCCCRCFFFFVLLRLNLKRYVDESTMTLAMAHQVVIIERYRQ